MTSPYNCPDKKCDYLGKDKQDIQRHYTGKHNILKMWVDEFLKQMEEDENGISDQRKMTPHLTFNQMEKIAIEQQAKTIKDVTDFNDENDEVDLSSINSNFDLSKSCLTISKISKTSKSQVSPLETPPSISLIRISKSPGGQPPMTGACAEASSLLVNLSNKANNPSNQTKPTLSFKFPCSECDMSFPTESARKLHLEVCQPYATVTVLAPPSPIDSITIDDDLDPPKKKKRPPPPLIPLQKL